MSLRVLVLGADGFIGGHVLKELARCDWASPVAASRRQTGNVVQDGTATITRLRLDATDEQALSQALQSIDAVVNCIAGNASTITSNASALVRAATRQPRPPRLLHLSSMAVYGAATGSVSETAPLAAEDPYGQAKIAAEQAVGSYPQAVMLRPGIVYGPGSRQWTERVARWLIARRLGDLGPAGDGCCNLVHVADVVKALLGCLQHSDVNGAVFNLAMAAAPTWNDYFIRFARALEATPVRRIGARRLKIEAKILAPPLKIAEIVAHKAGLRALRLPEAIPPSLLRLCRQDIRLDSARAERQLQLQWLSLDDGLRQAAHWFRQPAAIS